MALVALLSVSMIKGEGRDQKIKKDISFIPSKDDIVKVLNRVVLIACIINLVVMIINQGLLATILPLYVIENIGLSLKDYAFLVSAGTIGSITGNLVGGALSDKIGRKRILLISFIIGTLSILGLTIFTTLIPMLALMFFKGIFWGIVYGVVPAYIADSVPDEVRGIGIGTFRTFMDMGGLIGPVAMTTIVTLIGINGYLYSFYIGAASIIFLILLTLSLDDTTPTYDE
jgi:MFS family permease